MLEHGMSSGLYYVVAINVLTAFVGLLLYHYVIQRQAGLLSPDELDLLRRYPPLRASQTYTPEETFVRGAPPMRWAGWQKFFTESDTSLSRDAQVYLLFQRACMATTALCAVVSSVVLLPAYWSGAALVGPGAKPLSLVNLLRSDRGVFERFTSHNLPAHSPLVLLQIPVVAVAAACVVVLHTLVHAAAREHRSVADWLRAPPSPTLATSVSGSIFGVADPATSAPSPRCGPASASASAAGAPLALSSAAPDLSASLLQHPKLAGPALPLSPLADDVLGRSPYAATATPAATPAATPGAASLSSPLPSHVVPPDCDSPSATLHAQSLHRHARRHQPRRHLSARTSPPDSPRLDRPFEPAPPVFVSDRDRSVDGAVHVDVPCSPRTRALRQSMHDPFQTSAGGGTPPSARTSSGAFLGRSLRSPPTPLPLPPGGSPRSPMRQHRGWTLFARGLPMDIRSKSELEGLLSAIYPGQIRCVELVCKRRMSEARLFRALSVARNRRAYLMDSPHLDNELCTSANGSGLSSDPASSVSHNIWSRLLRKVFRRRRTRQGLIEDLTDEIKSLERDLSSRTAEPVRHFLGCAFITVGSSRVASSLMKDFPVRFRLADDNSGVRVWSINAQPETTAENSSPPCSPGVSRGVLIPPFSQSQTHELHEIPHYHPRHRGFLHDEDDTRGRFGLLRMQNLYHALLMLLPDWIRQTFFRSSGWAPLPQLQNGQNEDPLSQPPVRRHVSRGVAAARLRSMKAERAPKSGDVLWNNIGISFFERTCREVIVQMIVFACLIIFTSPVAMLTAMRLVFAEVSLLSDMGSLGRNGTHLFPTLAPLTTMLQSTNTSLDHVAPEHLSFLDVDRDHATEDITKSLMGLLPKALTSNNLLRSVMLAYIPVLLLSVTFAMVPSLLRGISSLEGYPTHTDREMSIFRKTSFYYLMNAVLLPSLALNTASEFLEILYKKSDGGANVYNALPILQTLFSGDIAFFLCNYLVQLALTGSVFWLMRLPSSFSMMIRRRLAVTPLEAAEAKCTSIFDFPRHYSYSVAVMAMCLLFGYMAPAIWFFACFYYLCKFHVDLYLLRYVHPRTHIDGRLPKLASTFVLVWTLVSQFALAAIFYLQGWVNAALVTALIGVITLAACVSVGPHLGSRLLGVIPRIRDYLISRFVMRWFDRSNVSLGMSSSTSSSASSLQGDNEVQALLRVRNSWPIDRYQRLLEPQFNEDAVVSDDSDREDSMMHWYEGEIAFRCDYGSTHAR